MAASTIAHQEAANLLTELIRIHGWRVASFSRVTGVNDSTVRKYMTRPPQTPEGPIVYDMARALGSRDGARLLYAFGLDELALELSEARLDPVRLHHRQETPEPVDLTLVTEAVRHQGELLEQIVAFLRDQGFAASVSNRDKPGFHAPLTPVTDITEWVGRPIPAPAVGF